MSYGKSVQFRDMQTVLKAFENRDVDAWAIFQDKQYLFKGMGIDELQNCLALIGTGSNAIYTLQVYEEITDIKKLKSNTVHDGSFNFRLNEPGSELVVGDPRYNRSVMHETMMQKLDAIALKQQELEQRLNEEDEEEEEQDEKQNSITGIPVIDSYLNDPSKLGYLFSALQQSFFPNAAPAKVGAAIGQVEQQQQQAPAFAGDKMEKMQRLSDALDKWEKADPSLVDLVVKIADLATNNPKMYQTAKGYLNMM